MIFRNVLSIIQETALIPTLSIFFATILYQLHCGTVCWGQTVDIEMYQHVHTGYVTETCDMLKYHFATNFLQEFCKMAEKYRKLGT
jgi:hypothetical protein